MYNQKLAKIFDTFGDIFEIHGQANDRFKTRAYRQASLLLQNLPKDISEYIDLPSEKFTEEIPGFGPAIKAKTIEFIKTNKIEEFENLKQTIPEGVLKMLDLKNVGPKKVKKFYQELQIETIEELKAAILAGKIAELEGMGKKSADKILESIENLEKYSLRTPLGLIYFSLKEIKAALLECEFVKNVEIAGSARRMQETIGDVDVLVTGETNKHREIIEYYKKLPFITQIEAEGETKVTAYLTSGPQIDFRVVANDEFGAAKQYFSGNQSHNVKLRTIAKNKGYKINEYGIYEIETNKKVGGAEETDMYQILGLQYIPVELRQGNNEIDIAAEFKIPELLKLEDIKGDLHSHSTYSDGNNSIEEMALEAIKLGYEYIAITDHSDNLKVAGGMSLDSLKAKKAEIEELNKKLGIRILYGTEVDILNDGSLDYDDETLAEFDIVIASVHTNLNKNTTERIIAAMNNPFVHIIGHPTTRLINKREPADLDFKKIFQAAKDTKTILEINAQPTRLDLPDKYIREGKESYGLQFIINTDAHNVSGLKLMELGVGYAKRGWLTKEDVINTLGLNDFLKKLKQKSK